jgi:hypothetical protein
MGIIMPETNIDKNISENEDRCGQNIFRLRPIPIGCLCFIVIVGIAATIIFWLYAAGVIK